jgi:hypothetical protein
MSAANPERRRFPWYVGQSAGGPFGKAVSALRGGTRDGLDDGGDVMRPPVEPEPTHDVRSSAETTGNRIRRTAYL